MLAIGTGPKRTPAIAYLDVRLQLQPVMFPPASFRDEHVGLIAGRDTPMNEAS